MAHLPVGEAKRGEARGGVSLVAETVSCLGGRGPVVPQAVGLDDETEIGPEEIDLEAVDEDFGDRIGKAGPGCERAKQALELGV